MSSLTLQVLVLWVTFVASQATHVVLVGTDGTFFNPPTLSARAGDTISFIFQGPAHTVTQSNASNPCLPLPGGFSSDIAGTATGPNGTTQAPPTWNLILTDDSKPIWYFCQLTQPSSHCGTGMVGVINPPAISVYNQVAASAKAVSGTPQPSLFLGLTGVGAFATAAPSVISSDGPIPSMSMSSIPAPFASSSSVPISSSASASASAAPDTTVSSSRSSKVGLIAGAAIGGTAGAVLIFLLLWLFKKRQQRRESSQDFFDYRVVPKMQQRLIGATGTPSFFTNSSNGSRGIPAGVEAGLVPNRRRSFENVYDGSTVTNTASDSEGLRKQTSAQSFNRPPGLYDSQQRQMIPETSQQRANLSRDIASVLGESRMITGHPYQTSQAPSSPSPTSPIPRPLPQTHPFSNNPSNPLQAQQQRSSAQKGANMSNWLYNPDVQRDSGASSEMVESPPPPLYRG